MQLGGGAVGTWMLDHADRHFDGIMTAGGHLARRQLVGRDVVVVHFLPEMCRIS